MQFPRHIPFVESLGFELLSFEGGEAEIALTLQEVHCNSLNMAHGGVLMTLLDVVMAHAARSPSAPAAGAKTAGSPAGVVTIEMKTSFMRPGLGRLLARGRLVHATATMAFCESSVFDEKGGIVAQATGTFKYLHAPLAGQTPRQIKSSDGSD